MTQPQDAALLDALQRQSGQLNVLLDRLELAQRTLVPGPANFWVGSARQAYDSSVTALASTVEAAICAIRSARDGTQFAIVQVVSRV